MGIEGLGGYEGPQMGVGTDLDGIGSYGWFGVSMEGLGWGRTWDWDFSGCKEPRNSLGARDGYREPNIGVKGLTWV